MAQHSSLGPSASATWLHCAGALALQAQCPPDQSTDFADEGTAGHELAALALDSREPCRKFIGEVIKVNGKDFVVDEEMADFVQVYVDVVRQIAGNDEVLVEQRVDFSPLLGQPSGKAFGTADAIILGRESNTLTVVDLKYGRGVRVNAEENSQLMLYALGALLDFGNNARLHRVRLVIVQPRLDHISEWTVGLHSLMRFADFAEIAADKALACTERAVTVADLSPGPTQCRWCRAKAICPALEQAVAKEFDLLPPETMGAAGGDQLARAMDRVDLIESWAKAVRAETERRLLSGQHVVGWKLVEGRRGARRWADEAAAKAALERMQLSQAQMFDMSLISPTSAEKLHKAGAIGPRQWTSLQTLVTQPEGRPSVAPASDKRPALSLAPSAAEFDVLT